MTPLEAAEEMRRLSTLLDSGRWDETGRTRSGPVSQGADQRVAVAVERAPCRSRDGDVWTGRELMTTDELFEILRDAYASEMWDEAFPPIADLDSMELRDIDGLLVQLETVLRAARRLKDQTESQAAFVIGDGGAARVGDTIYRYRPRLTTKITDPRALADWLGGDWTAVVPLTPSTQLRKGGVKAVCEKRDAEEKAFWDSFTETTEGDPTVERMPIDRAPKFLQKLGDGETV